MFRDKDTRCVSGQRYQMSFGTKIPDGFRDRESLGNPLRKPLRESLRESFRASLKGFLKGFATGRSVSGQRYQMGFGTKISDGFRDRESLGNT